MNLTALLENLNHTRILVIGDLMLDHYIWGDVYRISPEAPVPVVHATSDTYNAGGAANVALNLANLGIRTSILGHYIQDEAGQRLMQILSESGVELLKSPQTSVAPTIVKTRVVVRSQQLCRIDREVGRELYRIDSSPEFKAMLGTTLPEVDAVILSDYAKGVITQPLVDFIIKESRHRPDLLVAIDPKPTHLLSLYGVGLLTPNLSEAFQLAGLSGQYADGNYSLDEVCRRIYETYNPRMLVITLGAEGMAICEEGKVLEYLPTEAREVFDVSGAGDTVIATLTAALASGVNLSQAARLANAAAGCVVAHVGTAPVCLQEFKDRLNQTG